MSPEVSYFDPMRDARIDGLDAMKAMRRGGAAHVQSGELSAGAGWPRARSCALELYRDLVTGGGTLAHHPQPLSYIKPELKQPASEQVPAADIN
jgi:hypothetical protein